MNLHNLLVRVPEKYRSAWREFLTNPKNLQSFGLWTAAVIASFISVGFAMIFRRAETLFHRLVEHHPYAPFVVTPVLFVAAWLLVRRFAPEASGSGIPQVMAANETEYQDGNRAHVDRLLSVRTAVVKVCSSLLCILGGGAIGREGPTLQISTTVFHFVGRKMRRFVPRTSEQTWVVAGAAAGLASAFNTPLGGIVYAIEELGVSHFHSIRTALLSAVIVSGLVAQWLLGSYLYLGYPDLQPIGFSFLPMVLVNGLVTGLLGGLFGHILLKGLEARLSLVRMRSLLLLTVACGLVMASMIFFRAHAAGTGIEIITGYLFQDDNADSLLTVFRFFGTMVSYLSGAAGGIFSPSLAAGATIGAWMVQVFHTQHPNLMPMLGMIGFLTGVTRTPFTSFILVLEMTDRHSAIFPMMLVALVANWAARLTDSESFYEHVKRKWLPRVDVSTQAST